MATITPVECRRLAQGEPAHHADCTMTLDQGETLGFAGVVVRMSGGGATTESTLFLNQNTGHFESNVALPPMGTNGPYNVIFRVNKNVTQDSAQIQSS